MGMTFAYESASSAGVPIVELVVVTSNGMS